MEQVRFARDWSRRLGRPLNPFEVYLITGDRAGYRREVRRLVAGARASVGT